MNKRTNVNEESEMRKGNRNSPLFITISFYGYSYWVIYLLELCVINKCIEWHEFSVCVHETWMHICRRRLINRPAIAITTMICVRGPGRASGGCFVFLSCFDFIRISPASLPSPRINGIGWASFHCRRCCRVIFLFHDMFQFCSHLHLILWIVVSDNYYDCVRFCCVAHVISREIAPSIHF